MSWRASCPPVAGASAGPGVSWAPGWDSPWKAGVFRGLGWFYGIIHSPKSGGNSHTVPGEEDVGRSRAGRWAGALRVAGSGRGR